MSAEIKLPEAQRETLECLISWPADRPAPSYRDLMEALGLKSPAPIQARLARLAAKGLITWDPGIPRSIRVLRPGCQWVSVPEQQLPLVEAVLDPTPDTVATVEQWVATFRKQQRMAQSAGYNPQEVPL